ncbi:four-carbon acid sugar kinase family protein [Planococcus shenhongbingii]|uniref:Four-carbon acid sugar kinase family protein n=1 Tax=Planococcus shenhongbingii TaxID=3058398 RepID=A0ABT8N9F1_9BACL|nr:four-carbon acid sugar kinase family protein [Planococcus sp. N017]MDN7244515.1 four-carbon acid sugar kinase family protein [Planococcus sp. N017]
MTAQLGIIADDFTGANDSGVRLAQKGLKSKVILSGPEEQHDTDNQDIDVWIVDTDSRAMAEEDAYHAVFHEVTRLKKWGVESFYKKVDSTLRGSVAAELKALQDAAAMDVIFVAPAFPDMGRTVEEGVLYVNGAAVTETEFAQDPKTPVLHSYIPDLLASGNIKTAVLTRRILHSATPEKWVLEQVRFGVRWIVCDAVEEEDFRLLAQLEPNLDLKIGWAGSAGLINHLYTKQERGSQKKTLPKPVGKVLVVSGSLSAKTQEQLKRLEIRKATKMIEIDPLELLKDPVQAGKRISVLAEPDSWDSAVIFVDGSKENRNKVSEWATEFHWTANQTGKAISEGLGHLVHAALEVADFDAIIMTGGDTAKDICSILGILDMELLFEVEAGLPLGLVKWNNKELVAITKAGGFGMADSLGNAVNYLRGVKLHASK